MRILVKRNLCSGHARCASVAPDLFRLTDEGYIDVEDFDVPPGLEELARRGARACPERALRVAPVADVSVVAAPKDPAP
jgi:ferredoxin